MYHKNVTYVLVCNIIRTYYIPNSILYSGRYWWISDFIPIFISKFETKLFIWFLIKNKPFIQNLLRLRITWAEGFIKIAHPRNTIVVKISVALILNLSRYSKILWNKVWHLLFTKIQQKITNRTQMRYWIDLSGVINQTNEVSGRFGFSRGSGSSRANPAGCFSASSADIKWSSASTLP